MVGFSAEFLEMIENNQEDLLKSESLLSQQSMVGLHDDLDTINPAR